MTPATAAGAKAKTKADGPAYYDRDRVCDMPGCITILNRYNPGPDCLFHQEATAGVKSIGIRDPNLARLWVAIEGVRSNLFR